MGAVAAAVAAAALLGSVRIGQAWESAFRAAEFGDLPLPVLVFLTFAVVVSAPLALVGLAALAFAEETIEVGPGEITLRSTAFERTRVVKIPRADLECWRETYRPLPPWWTWAVRRLAAQSGGRLYPVAGAAGPGEKRAIALALSQATGRPLIGDRGRTIR